MSGKIVRKLHDLTNLQETPGVECQLLRDLLSYSRMLNDSAENVTAALRTIDTHMTKWEDQV